jgi:hypothetical protein
MGGSEAVGNPGGYPGDSKLVQLYDQEAGAQDWQMIRVEKHILVTFNVA